MGSAAALPERIVGRDVGWSAVLGIMTTFLRYELLPECLLCNNEPSNVRIVSFDAKVDVLKAW